MHGPQPLLSVRDITTVAPLAARIERSRNPTSSVKAVSVMPPGTAAPAVSHWRYCVPIQIILLSSAVWAQFMPLWPGSMATTLPATAPRFPEGGGGRATVVVGAGVGLVVV